MNNEIMIIELDLTEKAVAPVQEKLDPKRISTAEESVQFSKKVVAVLKEKAKAHNAVSRKKISLAQMKRVYLRGAENTEEGKTTGECALARVNLYMRIIAQESFENTFIQSKEKNGKPSWELDVTSAWKPAQIDFESAFKEATANSIDRNFQVGELYFEEESPLLYADTLRHFL